MCTDPDGNSLNYLKKAEVHNYDEQRRIHSITTRQKIQNCTKYTFRNERYGYSCLLEELDAKECALAFRLISKEKAANIFSCMSSKMQTYLVDMFSETELKELLDDLYMDDTVDMLEDLPANLVTRILKNLDSNKRSTINKLLKYPEDSAGSIMTTEYVTLKKQ